MKTLICLRLLSVCLTAGVLLDREAEAAGALIDSSTEDQPILHKQSAGVKSGGNVAVEVGESPYSQTASRQALAATQTRIWNRAFLSGLTNSQKGDAIRFELAGGEFAVGAIGSLLKTNGEVIYVSGKLDQPERGRFFFRKQTRVGVTEDFVGLVEFPVRGQAYRIEPSGPGDALQLVQRPLQDVLCVGLPKRQTAASQRVEKLRAPKFGEVLDLPIPPYQQGIVVLESLHGAMPVIYLDFAGGSTPAWGGITYARPNVSNDQIREVWSRVAEDFMPFNINITTDLQLYQNAPEGSRQRVIITPTDTAAPEAGGVAYIGSFNSLGETPCWVFMVSGKDCAEACSHEAGHTLGLAHEGQIINGTNYVYYYGQGSGETGWAPIMGVGFGENVSQWSKGEYIDANNPQDQLDIIATRNNNVTYRTDDTGDTLATSRYLELYPDYSASAQGVIERSADIDAFQFTTTGGPVSLRADPVPVGPDLAIQVTLCDSTDTILAMDNPQNTLWASLTTNLPAGTYTFKVTGAGRNNPLTNGFSSYASLGYYSITGSVANARLPTRFQISEHVANGTIVGTVPPRIGNGDPLGFSITSSNTGNTFAIDSSGTLTVADNTLLDYNTLASELQLAVQFELFVDITDLQDSSLSETNRRVVVAIVPLPPAITAQPQDLTAPADSTVSLQISAQSSLPLTFQWFFNGAALIGATDSTLVITNVQPPNAGKYFVTLMNWFSSATSQVAVVTVTPASPAVSLQPQPQATFPGFGATFGCAATGSEPLSYQWQLNRMDVPGATQASLSLTNVSLDQVGLYRAVVTNLYGSSTSAEAVLAMVPVAAWGLNSAGQTDLAIELTNAVQIAAGSSHNVALRRDGSVFAWGATNLCQVPPGLSNVIAVAAGADHSLVLRSNGKVFGWGDGSDIELDPPPGASIVAIAAAANLSLGLTSGGQVLGWGTGASGPNGLPLGLTNIVAIAAGTSHSLALRPDGTAIAWGDDTFRQTNVPTNLTDVVAIAAGGTHSLALKSDGTVVAWGNNANGQCAVPDLLTNVVGISAGGFNSFALRADGTLVGWGAGQAPNPTVYPDWTQSSVPATVTNVAEICSGVSHTLVLVGDGAPFITSPAVNRFLSAGSPVFFRASATGAFPLSYQWQFMGTNLPGATSQLLILKHTATTDSGPYEIVVSNAVAAVSSYQGLLTVQASPFVITQPQDQNIWLGRSGSLQVVAGGQEPLYYQWSFNGAPLPGATNPVLTFAHAAFSETGAYSVLISNNSGYASSQKVTLNVSQVVGWGPGTNWPNYGQTTVPLGLTGVVQLAAGTFHSLALKNDGTVVAWGAGVGQTLQGEASQDHGQCSVPAGLNHVIAIAAGEYHSLALTDQGEVVAWGAGANNLFETPYNYGQSTVPVGLNGVSAIAAGDYHSAAVTQDGRVIVWGARGFGLSGPTNVPPTATNVVSIASRGDNIVALRSDGSIVEWGTGNSIVTSVNAVAIAAASYGYLALRANGPAIGTGSLAPPPGLHDLLEVAAGYDQALTIKSNGTVVTWGQTNFYALAAIPAGLSNVIDIAGGQYDSLALLGDGSLSINRQPTDRTAILGGRSFFSAGVVGAQPFGCQWLFNGKELPGATNSWLSLQNLQFTNSGDYQAVVTNLFGAVTSRVAILSVLLPLGPALSATTLAWTCSGSAPWFGETNTTHGGGAQAAQSGAIGASQQSSLQTSLVGPGSLRFWWKVSSKQGSDYLNFSIDGVKQTGISGEVDWQQLVFDIPSGPHTVSWTYAKDASTPAGLDCGWVAEVSSSPAAATITSQPASQVVNAGQSFVLTVAATGTAPLTYQWLEDGTNLPKAGATSLWIPIATRRNTGNYAVVVSSPGASVQSSNAFIQVISPQRLENASWQSDGSFRIVSGDIMGVPLLPSELAGFQTEVSTNLVDWTALGIQLELTNGDLVLIDPGATNTSGRFYRIIEHLPAGP